MKKISAKLQMSLGRFLRRFFDCSYPVFRSATGDYLIVRSVNGVFTISFFMELIAWCEDSGCCFEVFSSDNGIECSVFLR